MSKRKYPSSGLVFLFLIFCILIFNNCTMPDPVSKKALNELLMILKKQPEFIKVHAAEYLIWLGHTEEVRKEFLHENELHGDQPKYRIGIWRVLSQTEKNLQDKQQWNGKIYQAFGDLNGPDRLHASETLAKLQLSPGEKYPEATQKSLLSDNKNLQVYTLWATSYASKDSLNKNRERFIVKALNDTTVDVRKISSYILRRMGLNPNQWAEFAEKALAEPSASDLKLSLLTSAFITQSEKVQEDLKLQVRTALLKDTDQLNYAGQIEVAIALSEKGGGADLELLKKLLDKNKAKVAEDADDKQKADVRAAAAYAILKIKQRQD
jgi:peptidoglycan hydrolase-like protein with peptidoglycan-binding domain